MAHLSEPHAPTEQALAHLPLWVGRCALRAALHEAAATGKPGLVCTDTCGAHADMDIRTLFLSAVTLQPYFQQAAELGLRMAQSSAAQTFEALRPLGLGAEQAMFTATRGVNTHKGLIFSLGLCCAAVGRLCGQDRMGTGPATPPTSPKPGAVCAEAAQLVQGIVTRDFAHLRHGGAPHSAGEQYFCATGNGGIRAEAEAGFPHALQAWTLFCSALPDSDFNTACLMALLHLMAHVPDSTVWHRAGQAGQSLVHREAAHVLALVQKQGMDAAISQQALAALRHTCLARRLSPGGCADLLAVTLFLYFMTTDAPAESYKNLL